MYYCTFTQKIESKKNKIMNKTILFALFFGIIISAHAQTAGTLTVSVATSSTDITNPLPSASSWNNSDYAPHYGVAIWVEDNNGKFIKTLSLWCPVIKKYWLKVWSDASTQNITGLTAVADIPAPILPQPDATTGATLANYGTLTCSWNGKDNAGNLVPDGIYNLKMELSDNDPIKLPVGIDGKIGIGGKVQTIQFTKGASSDLKTKNDAPTVSCLGNYNVKWTSNSTGLNDVELSKLYTIYPNPAKSYIFVNGLDIQQIEILTQEGASLMKANQQRVNISSLSQGVYLVNITTKRGVLIKKIVKQ